MKAAQGRFQRSPDNVINYFKKVIYLIVLFSFSSVFSGSFEDFFSAIRADDPVTVSRLLRLGFDPNTRSPNQQTGLIQATRDGAWQVFDVLLASPKINVNAANQYSETPLMYVALIGDLPRVK
ncbi:MAG: ankyrin repeat domain-containing protein, partial [Betaproteobacteria bacterium]|nr:ankyrin repeat domain-containing protein [Betaproteobacteria bacterium]